MSIVQATSAEETGPASPGTVAMAAARAATALIDTATGGSHLVHEARR